MANSSTRGTSEAEKYASFLKHQSWMSHPRASLRSRRHNCAAVAVDGHIIVIGGEIGTYFDQVLNSVERCAVRHSKDNSYTLALSRWKALPDAIKQRACHGAAVVPPSFGVSVNSDAATPNILVAGGCKHVIDSSAAEAEMFDFSTNQWRNRPSMHEKRIECAMASWRSMDGGCEGCVYVVGGYDGRKRLGSVECLSFSARDTAGGPTWTLLPSHMQHPRNGSGAVVVEGRPVHSNAHATPRQLVVMGGFTDDGYTSSVEAYDLQTREWEALPPMKYKRAFFAAVAVGQCIYVVGGEIGKKSLATAEYFDFRTRQWTLLPRMSKRRSGCAAVVVDEHMVVLGGYDGSDTLRCVESFRIAVVAPQKMEFPSLPPPTNVVGGKNRIQLLEQWCVGVEKTMANVKDDIEKQEEFWDRTMEEEVAAAKKRCKEEILAAEERHKAHVEALKSLNTNGGWEWPVL